PVGPQPSRQGQFRLFMSHLAIHEEFVGAVGANLGRYGVSSFVAHVSIEPSEEWQNVIESALRSCDAMAVFLHTGFHERYWCCQEVGVRIGAERCGASNRNRYNAVRLHGQTTGSPLPTS